jgi:hypothetical protein
VVADKAQPALGVEVLAVEADDASGLLAAVLERVQAERGQSRGVGMIENPEDAALLVQPVFLEPAHIGFLVSLFGHGHGASPYK